jgi:methylthioribose-1-phosphate isomerase
MNYLHRANGSTLMVAELYIAFFVPSLTDLTAAKHLLDDARPTAVNLSWATTRILDLANALSVAGMATVSHLRTTLLAEAQELADEDVRINKRLGDYGAALIKPNSSVIHHCNTG